MQRRFPDCACSISGLCLPLIVALDRKHLTQRRVLSEIRDAAVAVLGVNAPWQFTVGDMSSWVDLPAIGAHRTKSCHPFSA